MVEASEQPAGSEWRLSYQGYDPAAQGLREALCTLGNGYICTRAASPDSAADGTHYPGTYRAGLYDRAVTPIKGREVENEDLVNLPNWLPLTFRIDGGDWMAIDAGTVDGYVQTLDLRRGLLLRGFRFRDAEGRTTRWDERRFVSMSNQHVMGLEVTLTPMDWSGRLEVRSALDGGVTNSGVARYRDLEGRHLEPLAAEAPDPDTTLVHVRTRQSRQEVAVAARTRLFDRTGDRCPCDATSEAEGAWAAVRLGTDVTQGTALVVEKIAALHCSRDRALSEATQESLKTVREAPRFDILADSHATAWRHLWSDFDMGAETHEADGTLLKLRVHVFHLLQTVSDHTTDLDVGVPPRGWHGEAYRGHIFWDELFIFPFLTLRRPVMTRALLRYRYRRLPEARRAARAIGLSGAMYPWQSGSNGREESQEVHLNPKSGRWIPDDSHRQRHINAAVAYNVWHYFEVTEDMEFLYDFGAEMILETARFWASKAEYVAEEDRYHIRGVMGPDEYHTAYPDADPEAGGGLDDNAYTNVMVTWTLNRALDVIALLPADRLSRLCDRLGLGDHEMDHWEEIGRRLVLPFHEAPDGRPILSQFAGYGDLQEFDWAAYRETYGDIMRLDRILEAEDDTPNRYKVSKQADALMLFYLFSADELARLFEQLGYPFEPDTIQRTIAYYLDRTSHGSTLSFVTHAWVLARSDRPRSWRLCQEALKSDLCDIQGGTTAEGIHIGAMAGSIDLMQRCYLGIETRENVLHFNPMLPAELKRLRVTLRYRQQRLDIDCTRRDLTVTSQAVTAAPVTISYRGHTRLVSPGSRFRFRLFVSQERDRQGLPRTTRDGARQRGEMQANAENRREISQSPVTADQESPP